MSNVVQLQGQIQAGPPGCGGCSGLGMLLQLSLQLKGACAQKPYNVATGGQPRIINSAAVFVALGDVGPTGVVTRADTLFFYSPVPIDLELTTDDGAGGDVVAIVPLDGTLVLEFPTQKPLKLLRVRGTATIQYFASGPA